MALAEQSVHRVHVYIDKWLKKQHSGMQKHFAFIILTGATLQSVIWKAAY